MLREMEDVDSHDRMVVARWVVLLIFMEAWTIQLFAWRLRDLRVFKGADEALFFPSAEIRQAQTRDWQQPCLSQYDKHYVKILKERPWS